MNTLLYYLLEFVSLKFVLHTLRYIVILYYLR
jgi:hypothetical protein